MSLRQKILDLVNATDGRVTGLEIERFSLANGYKSSNGSRRARELSEDGLIKANYDENGWVYYTKKEPEPKYKFVPQFTPEGTVRMIKQLVCS